MFFLLYFHISSLDEMAVDDIFSRLSLPPPIERNLVPEIQLIVPYMEAPY